MTEATQEQEVTTEPTSQPDDVTLEDVKLDEVPPPSLDEVLANHPEIELEEIPPELLQMFGIGMVNMKPANLRKAEPFQDLEFKAIHTHTEAEGTEAEGFESFPGTEFEAKLNDAVDRKLNLKFLYRCPNKPDCLEDWHQYVITYRGDEYVDWFIATKMSVRNGIWIDERKEKTADGAIAHDHNAGTDSV